MALVSPGVQVTVIDESTYAPNNVGTIASIVVATAQDKISGTGATIAPGTTAENANKTYIIGSQRELVSTFGSPLFYKTASNTPIHGYEINEYGLMAAYSLLGVSNNVHITRADIDLNELVSTSSRPKGSPSDRTLWLDTIDTSWGIFEWSKTAGSFTNKVPVVITNTDDLIAGAPKASMGIAGDYAIVATNTSNPMYYKNRMNTWVLVGSTMWQTSHATIEATIASPTLVNGESIILNGTTVVLNGTTISSLKTDINTASVTGVTADVINNKLEIYATDSAASDGVTTDGKITLANSAGTILTDAGLTAGVYASPRLQQTPHYSIPEWKTTDTTPRPAGSVWIKTTASNLGASFDIASYNTAEASFGAVSAPLYVNDRTANKTLDPTGGQAIAFNSMYVQYDVNENKTATYKLFRRAVEGSLAVIGEVNTATPITAGNTFTVQTSQANSAGLSALTTVTTSGTSLADLASDLNGANVNNLSASVNSSGYLVINHTLGGVIVLKDITGTPIADAGFTSSIVTGQVRAGNDSDLILSNWVPATYTATESAPSSDPSNNRLWYHAGFDADVMIHDGQDWRGYHNVINDARGHNLADTDPEGVIFSASEPLTQSDESALVNGDLWLDTGDLDNYPTLYRYETVASEAQWVLIDNSDQESENGIIFADARFMGNTTTDIVTGTVTSTADLLTSDVLDIDAPLPEPYPRGTLLFNTRRSTYSVKQFRSNYFSRSNFSDTSVYPVLPSEKDAWVTVSGNKNDGSPYMGRKAVRKLVVAAMKEATDTSTDLRDEARLFNLIATPGYPELITNMVKLNNDRRQTAFVIGDTPLRLQPTGTDIQRWSTNASGAADNGEDGLITADYNLGVFYSAAQTTDLTGNVITVPSSHMMLRTISKSDDQSYPWFAPAGARRGLVDNVTSIGYIDAATGEYTTNNVRESLRDVLYTNKINPITFMTSRGILNYGNKTRSATDSSLDRINVARLTAFLRGQLHRLAINYVHEPNDKITRDELKQQVEQILNDLVVKRGVYDYLVVCDESNNTPDRIDRSELYVDVAIEPVKAAEFIYIPIRLKNTGEISG